MPLCAVAWLSESGSQSPCMYKKGTFQALNKLAGSPHISNTNHFSSHLVLQTVRQIRPCHMETAISKIREVGEYTVPSFELKDDRKDNEISGSDLRKAPRIHNLYLFTSAVILCFAHWPFQNGSFFLVVNGLCQFGQAAVTIASTLPWSGELSLPLANEQRLLPQSADRQPRSNRNHSRSLATCLQKDEND